MIEASQVRKRGLPPLFSLCGPTLTTIFETCGSVILLVEPGLLIQPFASRLVLTFGRVPDQQALIVSRVASGSLFAALGVRLFDQLHLDEDVEVSAHGDFEQGDA